MSNTMTFTVEIGGKDITRHVPFPLKWERVLDERLDTTRISVKQLDEKIIHPLTPAKITMTDLKGNAMTVNAVVTTDQSTEVPVGSGKYDHEIYMLEETKILEGIDVEALTFTNDLGRNYSKNARVITPNIIKGDFPYSTPTSYVTPLGASSLFTFVKATNIFPTATTGRYDLFGYTVRFNNSEIAKIPANGEGVADVQEDYALTLESGVYEVEYRYKQLYSGGTRYETIISYSFAAVENHDPLPRWNIASVIDRVLDLVEPHLEGVAPRFVLNAEQHAEFEKIEAPEFAFTNSTLKEILDQIGGFIHGIPRLIGNTIYYDMLGGTKQAKLADPKYAYVGNAYSQDIESYCSSLDSTVDNLVCLTDPVQGSITEPCYDGHKTVRTETVYARVEEGNMFISTQHPIYQIRGVKQGATPKGGLDRSHDITEYIFESAEYARLSSYSTAYPTSKAYALYYTQGQKNIYGLNFKLPDVTGGVFSRYAIVNILNAAANMDKNALPYMDIPFQVEYIPVFSARVQQTKQYIGDIKQPRSLFYNQGANLVETRYFGENMKGAVARMGNVDRVVIYNLQSFSLIPEIGEMYGEDYYISGVTCELFPYFVKCQLTLSQDFNRLSQYIGINSVRRYYEVSEKQAYRRNPKYADYIVIGDEVEQDETLVQNNGMALLQDTFSQNAQSHSVSGMWARGQDKNGNFVGSPVILPVISTAQGTAMIFTANYEDNYSAGQKVQYESEGSVSGYFSNATPSTDYYGRFQSLRFAMHTELKYFSLPEQQALPQTLKGPNFPTSAFGTEKGLTVRKDGAEILSINYVLEFVTNRRNYIIGSALARNCPLVRGTDTTRIAALYTLPARIGKFTDKVDLSTATKIYDFSESGHITESGKSAKFADFTPAVDGAAWVIATKNGEVLLASNEPITAGQTVSMPYMTLRHNIYNL